MLNRTLAWAAKVTAGRLSGSDVTFGCVSTDSRTIPAGGLFVALEGEHHDGHDFVAKAAERDVAGALVSRRVAVSLPQIVASDAHEALATMAHAWRRGFDVPVAAVTGSSGKTTVKELIAAILSVEHPVCATQGNFNNHIGVPLTLMRIAPDDQALVIEMGANHAGEIAHLAALVEPSVGVITNAGAAHLEGFGSLASVAAAKGELLDALPSSGTAVLNVDDPYFDDWKARSRAGYLVTFGLAHKAAFGVVAKPTLAPDGARFLMRMPDAAPLEINLPLPGIHSVLNALAAAAAASAMGASAASIVAGLASAKAVHGRLKRVRGLRGSTVIDDAYNANPSSVRVALDYLGGLVGRRVFVLGDMAELGSRAIEMHREIGAYAAARCDEFVAIGSLAEHAAAAFGPRGRHCGDVSAAAELLSPLLDDDVTVLIKASRVMGLDRLAALLAAPADVSEVP